METDDDGYIEGNADFVPVVKKRDIESIPAVDAVEVVRCSDCAKSFIKGENRFCTIHRSVFDQERGRYVLDESFCSWGQRREEEP